MVDKPYASIIIIVKNGMPDITTCLNMVFQQRTDWPYEVIIVDSGSTDGTIEYVKKYPLKLIRIKPEEFNHGNTRNLGAENAEGKFLVYLVADAIPLNESWLSNLVNAASDPKVGGAYSRHIPRPDHNLLVRYKGEGWPTFSNIPRIQILESELNALPPIDLYWLCLFSDVSACMRKEIWDQFHYAPMNCEDADWSKRIIEAGFSIKFEPLSVVVHSHQRPWNREFKRTYVFEKKLEEIFNLQVSKKFFNTLKTFLWGTMHYWSLLLDSKESIFIKLELFFKSPLYASMVFAQYLGENANEWSKKYHWYLKLDEVLSKGTQ